MNMHAVLGYERLGFGVSFLPSMGGGFRMRLAALLRWWHMCVSVDSQFSRMNRFVLFFWVVGKGVADVQNVYGSVSESSSSLSIDAAFAFVRCLKSLGYCYIIQ